MGFTFVNTTGTPELSKSDARRMRSHVTKTNFALRRERLTDSCAPPRGKSRAVVVRRDARPGNLLLATPPKDPGRYAQYSKSALLPFLTTRVCPLIVSAT